MIRQIKDLIQIFVFYDNLIISILPCNEGLYRNSDHNIPFLNSPGSLQSSTCLREHCWLQGRIAGKPKPFQPAVKVEIQWIITKIKQVSITFFIANISLVFLLLKPPLSVVPNIDYSKTLSFPSAASSTHDNLETE